MIMPMTAAVSININGAIFVSTTIYSINAAVKCATNVPIYDGRLRSCVVGNAIQKIIACKKMRLDPGQKLGEKR